MVEGPAGNNVRERNRWRGRGKQTKDQRGTDGGEEEHVYADEGVIVSASLASDKFILIYWRRSRTMLSTAASQCEGPDPDVLHLVPHSGRAQVNIISETADGHETHWCQINLNCTAA